MQISYSYSDDYAILESGNLKLYYGYEREDPETEEYCFTVEKNRSEIFRLTTNEIQENLDHNSQLNDLKDYLMVGIGMWLLLKNDL